MADLTELGRCTKTGRLSVQSGELKRAPKPSEHRFSYMRAMNCGRHHGSEFSLNRASLMHVQTTTIKPRPSCIGILCVLPRISTLCTQSVCRTLVSLGGPHSTQQQGLSSWASHMQAQIPKDWKISQSLYENIGFVLASTRLF
jgi:hypothetical protein